MIQIYENLVLSVIVSVFNWFEVFGVLSYLNREIHEICLGELVWHDFFMCVALGRASHLFSHHERDVRSP